MKRSDFTSDPTFVEFGLKLIDLSYDMRRYGPGSGRLLMKHDFVRRQDAFAKRGKSLSYARQIWQGRQIMRGALSPGSRNRPVGSRSMYTEKRLLDVS